AYLTRQARAIGAHVGDAFHARLGQRSGQFAQSGGVGHDHQGRSLAGHTGLAVGGTLTAQHPLVFLAHAAGAFAGLLLHAQGVVLGDLCVVVEDALLSLGLLRGHLVLHLRLGFLHGVVVLRHALRGGLLPVVSYLGPAIASMLTGSVVVEKIFNVPGIGPYFVDAAFNRDYFLVMGIVLLYAFFLLLLNLIVDLLYGFLDPRIDYS
ncbi:MAG: ABC transporter permease subunit, partial [Planctomycetia bacterium]|nr:ABC transporter permease subunit [Planctomycetia bacterium]